MTPVLLCNALDFLFSCCSKILVSEEKETGVGMEKEREVVKKILGKEET